MKSIIIKTALTYFLFLFLNIDLSAQKTGLFTTTFNDRGTISTIYCSVPTDYSPDKNYPLLLAWHGSGDGGSNMRYIITSLLGNNINAIVICPDANKVNGKDSSYFYNLGREAYYYAKNSYSIDQSKTVVMGFSWGGKFSFEFGLLNTNLFKGIIGHAPAIGSLSQDMWSNIKNVRMATILGDKDFNYVAVNSLMNSIINKNANLLYLVKPGVVHVDNAYFNSQEIIDDYRKCYEYVIGNKTDIFEYTIENIDIKLYNITDSKLNIEKNLGNIKIYDYLGNYLGVYEYPYLIDNFKLKPKSFYFGIYLSNNKSFCIKLINY
jgi:hypothetical protein